MRYYRVQVLTTDGLAPDVPAGTPWVGNLNADNTAYLIKTPADLGMQPVTDSRYFGEVKINPNLPELALEVVCGAMGLSTSDVMNVWRVG